MSQKNVLKRLNIQLKSAVEKPKGSRRKGNTHGLVRMRRRSDKKVLEFWRIDGAPTGHETKYRGH